MLARTIFSVSPKTLNSEENLYKEIVKGVPWKYYMAPWELDELKECRDKVEAFHMVPEDFMEHLYEMIGGVPRYVLEVPRKELDFYSPEDRCKKKVRAVAESSALERVNQALDNIKDPMKILQYFEQAKDSQCYSSHLLHRYPTKDHRGFRLVWASDYIMEEVHDAVDDKTWNELLNRLANGRVGEGRGAMFELYMRRILRIGNRCFQARNLHDNTEITIDIKASPDVKWFNTLECYKGKMQGSLWIPNSKRFACVDMLLAPNYLLQVTTNKDHGIKSKPFKAFLKSMRENKWIHSSEEVALIFVVPQDQIKEFKKQNFKTGTNRVDSKATKELLDVKQYIMGIDLQAELRQKNKNRAVNGHAN
ncbi:hypothetical protein BCR41DRAFT_147034 [Lobosporangium transversale]|uniref:Uncharacterized protein n=1 Tax=Lobosporangium transversale TaxID=64571 RepID=A0A1Y2GDZ2_9FUNG|nr:hypothetical protein BCR41DRAFT_147034 [Lobosporangium transversale]ORZ08232.1 hypothetical protein BCR41DRAFT_147034 [Lobosporangium transversale]|eukprot:XP_021878315.1 hypothetical protein BCR41DRAFT_147034 [Lobosporangium transversale]